jgi:predicted transcriptional regulator
MEELKRIRAALAAGISKSDLAARSGVSTRLLAMLDAPDFNPTLQTLTALASAADELVAERIAALKGVA